MLLDGNPAGRALVLRKAREQTMAKSRGHYPALIAAIDVVRAGYERGVAHGYREESRRFGDGDLPLVAIAVGGQPALEAFAPREDRLAGYADNVDVVAEC